MKTKIYIKLILCIALPICMFVSSCGDDFLEPKPLSFLTPENTYIDKAGFEGVLNTCRKQLRLEYMGNNCYINTEIQLSDLAAPGQNTPQSLKNLDVQLLPGSYGDTAIDSMWTNGWRSIKYANIIISRCPDAPALSENDRNVIMAEAYFHRSYWYYKFVNQFGDVPLVLEEITEPKRDFYSTSRATILQQIKKDMEFAVQYLPATCPYGAVNAAAGNHLLTKIYLAVGEFDKAVEAANRIINNSQYALMKTRFGVDAGKSEYDVYWDLFQSANICDPANKEMLMCIQDLFGIEGYLTSGSQRMRDFVPQWWNNLTMDPDGKRGFMDGVNGEPFMSTVGRGIGRHCPTNFFKYDAWEAGDIRHEGKNWFTMEDLIYNNKSSKWYGQKVKYYSAVSDAEKAKVTDTIMCWYPFQYCKCYRFDNTRTTNPQGGNTNWYVFRLSETYLLRAEAYFWKGDLQKAADDLNQIRERVGIRKINASEVTIDFILDERARELYLEEPRRSEMVRIAFIMATQGKDGYDLNNMTTKNFFYDRMMKRNQFVAQQIRHDPNNFKISPKHILYPVPETAIESNSLGHINQTPGYPGSENNIPPITEVH